jgi:hypothetical protein
LGRLKDVHRKHHPRATRQRAEVVELPVAINSSRQGLHLVSNNTKPSLNGNDPSKTPCAPPLRLFSRERVAKTNKLFKPIIEGSKPGSNEPRKDPA